MSIVNTSTIRLEYVVALLPVAKCDVKTAIAAFAFEDDAREWMENDKKYGFDLLEMHRILPKDKNAV